MQLALPCIIAVLLSSSALGETPAGRVFPASCREVKELALPYFASRELPLSPLGTCPGCFSGQTSDLRDTKGKSIDTGRAMKLYMAPSLRKSNPIVWYTHSKLKTTARLTLRQKDAGCASQLIFEYGWYGAQFIAVVPVDGDPESRPSNLHLENEYLDEIAKLVSRRNTASSPNSAAP